MPTENGEGEDRIAEEAAGWVARLQSSDATDDDREQFARWLAIDPSHGALYEELRTLWGQLKDVPVATDQLAKMRKSRGGTLTVVAALLGAATLVAVLQTGFFNRLRSDHSTSVGEVRSVTLSDGSSVDLNTDTAILLSFTDKERRVTLLRGEAFFDVKSDPNRPFVVVEGDITAEAVGTRYSVASATNISGGSVQVLEGRVKVGSAKANVTIRGGEGVRVDRNGEASVFQLDEDDLAWRMGKLVFSQRPLIEVLAALDRYRPGKIFLLDRGAGRQPVSGIFDVRDADHAIDAIQQNLPLAVTKLPGGIVFVRSR
jgi:transmembrane sensor